jgi:TrmH family RNA methyltransferase
MDVGVVLVRPQEGGNIGAVARAMKNFGFKELVLVRPCELGGVARAFASHGIDILEKARIVDSFEDAIDGYDYIIGTTGKKGGQKTPKREAVTPEKLRALLGNKSGRMAVLFGNERYGLPNKMLEKTDFVVRVPSDPAYPILNLAQSVCVILYELSKSKFEKTVGDKPLSREERGVMERYLKEITKEVYDQPHQQRHVEDTLKLVFSRALLTKKEGRRIISFFRKILRKID